jgi:predicted porin
MKKSLFALAALGAFATAAQAQSTVTLYGTFDTSIAYLTGLQATTSTAITNASNSITTGDGLSYIDGSWATSSWGMRGSEDLGGGMKANFHLESDTLTNTGNTHSSGLFRRAANVSLADAKFGEVFLGRRGNAYIIATGQMLPVQGNTAQVIDTNNFVADIFIKPARAINFIQLNFIATRSGISFEEVGA